MMYMYVDHSASWTNKWSLIGRVATVQSAVCVDLQICLELFNVSPAWPNMSRKPHGKY